MYLSIYISIYLSIYLTNLKHIFQEVNINVERPAQPVRARATRRRRKIIAVGDIVWAQYSCDDYLPGIIKSNMGNGKLRVQFFEETNAKYSISIQKCL